LALANNLSQTKGTLNGESLKNIGYVKIRDKFSNYGRLQKRKDKEVVERNEKMFNRLLYILQNEKTVIHK
jgi:hypothetical protein